MSEAPVLEVRGLAKRYGHVRALRSLDLEVGAGELLAVFGPNGAGKTTLLRLVAALAKPTGGEILLDGRPLFENLQRHRRRLGYVSHQSLLYDSLSPIENLRFAGRLHGVRTLDSRIDELVSLRDEMTRYRSHVGTQVDAISADEEDVS